MVFRLEMSQRDMLVAVLMSSVCFETPRISERPPQIFELSRPSIDNRSLTLHTDFSSQSMTKDSSTKVPRMKPEIGLQSETLTGGSNQRL